MTPRAPAAAIAAAILVAACGRSAPAAGPHPRPASVPTDAAASAAVDAAATADAWADVDRPALWNRVAVLGASVSAGFAAPRIAEAIRVTRAIDDDIVLDAADGAMFRDPWRSGAAQVGRAIDHHATLVLALDFLFWYAYQDGDGAARAASLERGLTELARLDVPLAVGDVPDMRTADPRMLPAERVPTAGELAAMNTRVHAWAAASRHTIVLPLASWSARLAAGERIDLGGGETIAADKLLFLDHLHPNPLGLWWMLDQINHQLEREVGVPADAISFARP